LKQIENFESAEKETVANKLKTDESWYDNEDNASKARRDLFTHLDANNKGSSETIAETDTREGLATARLQYAS
jgi:hypothetical protein